MSTFDFVTAVREEFEDTMQQYHLASIVQDDGQVYLVGRNFALGVTDDFDEIRLTYVIERPIGTLAAAPIRDALVGELAPEDRALGGTPRGRAEQVRAALRVFAAGLVRRRTELLRGDPTWVDHLARRDAPRTGLWRPLPPRDAVRLLAEMRSQQGGAVGHVPRPM